MRRARARWDPRRDVIEAAILDCDESLRQVFRQFLDALVAETPLSPRVTMTVPSMPAIWIEGGRFGTSSDWIEGRCAPTQPIEPDHSYDAPQGKHRAPIDPRGRGRCACAAWTCACCSPRLARGLRSRGAIVVGIGWPCAWREASSSACRRRWRDAVLRAEAQFRSAMRRARIAAPCGRRAFSVPTPYANAAHTGPAAR